MLDGGVVWWGRKSWRTGVEPLRTFLKPFEDTIQIISIWRSSAPVPARSLMVTIPSHRNRGILRSLALQSSTLSWDTRAPSEQSRVTMIYWHGPDHGP
jgi:hypothetical protein